LGRIVRAHGVLGEVRVRRYHEGSSLIREQRSVLVGSQRYGVRAARAAGDADLLVLEGVTTREAAEALKGSEVYVPREALPRPADDEIYLADLIGLAVFAGERPIGRVVGVVTHPSSTCFVVEGDEGVREIPAVAPYFAALDLDAGTIGVAHVEDFPPERPRAKAASKEET
jgi:16S rRNA processing protein RimM